MTDAGFSFLAAVTLGLLGSVHCMAMCGGLAGALALVLPADAPAWARVRLLASVSGGRILGYAMAGGLAGGVGLAFAQLLGATGAAALRALAGFALIAIAFLVAGVGRAPLVLERLGARVWRRLQPLAIALKRDLGPGNAVLLGLLWGWLPCGLVYSALGWAATTGGPLHAALVMIGFGIGTLPGVVLPGVAALRLGRVVQAASARRVAAVMLAAFGVWTLLGAATLLRAARSGVGCHDTAAGHQTRAVLDAGALPGPTMRRASPTGAASRRSPDRPRGLRRRAPGTASDGAEQMLAAHQLRGDLGVPEDRCEVSTAAGGALDQDHDRHRLAGRQSRQHDAGVPRHLEIDHHDVRMHHVEQVGRLLGVPGVLLPSADKTGRIGASSNSS